MIMRLCSLTLIITLTVLIIIMLMCVLIIMSHTCTRVHHAPTHELSEQAAAKRVNRKALHGRHEEPIAARFILYYYSLITVVRLIISIS